MDKRISVIVPVAIVALALAASCAKEAKEQAYEEASKTAPIVEQKAPASIEKEAAPVPEEKIAPAAERELAPTVEGKIQALDGKDLAERRCTVCHNTDRIYRSRRGQAEWGQVVGRMIGKGAKLDAEERRAVIGYLSSRY
ncbi:MAG: hypothetical protein ABII00_07945 [Elusimicrobiota bacterium]